MKSLSKRVKANPLTNYKLIDDIILELSKRLKILTQ